MFSQYIDARLECNSMLKRCAAKGWPDMIGAIDVAARLQEALLKSLVRRLDYVLQSSDPTAPKVRSYATTAQIHIKVDDGWSAQEEASLLRTDAQYALLIQETENLKGLLDSEGLKEPYRMAKKDRELIAALWDLKHKVQSLDDELSSEIS
jgi:hypothetical protein